MAESKENTKQLLDISRSMTEVLGEFKGINESLEKVTQFLNPEVAKSIKDIVTGNKDILGMIKGAKSSGLGEKAAASKENIPSGEGLKGILSSDRISSVLGGIKGSFRKGGKTKDSGNYLVGENGPEVVSLPGGSTIIPLDVSDLIDGLNNVSELRKDLDDKVLNYDSKMNAIITDNGIYPIDSLKKSYESDVTEANLMNVYDEKSAMAVTALQKLQEKISISAAAKEESKASAESALAPKSSGPSVAEIEAERKRLLAEDPEFYGDPKNLEDELNSFVSSYDFKPGFKVTGTTQEPELNEKVKSSKGKEKTADEELADGEKKSGRFSGAGDKAKGLLKGSGSSAIAKTGLSFLSEKSGLNAKAAEIGQKFGLSEGKSEALLGAGGATLAKGISALSKKREEKKAGEAKSRVSTEIPSLNPPTKKEETKTEESKIQKAIESVTKKEAAPENPTAAPQAPTPPAKAESPSSSSEPIESIEKKDVKDMISILSTISRTLSGPLNFTRVDPYRPDSRRI
jgi:hypothetical protein